MGFPTRISRDTLGPTLVDQYQITDETKQLGADTMNEAWWNLSGVGLVIPRVVITATVTPGTTTVSTVYQGIAWDPNGSLSNLSWVYAEAGRYTFAFSSAYNDEAGNSVSIVFSGGIVHSQQDISDRGTHTGSNNVAVLTDSTQSWQTNELAGRIIYNITDGSKATIASNTATTVTGTLSGGTDDDWDTDDAYIVSYPQYVGVVDLITNYSGQVIFRDSSNDFADPGKFIMQLW